MKNKEKWDKRFLELAKFVSNWSKDPSTKVGAVIVDENKIVVGIGYNGFPRNVPDNEEDYLDKEKKYKLIVHAEVNAILNSSVDFKNRHSTIYIWPLFSCVDCAKVIVQSGIKRVVSIENDKKMKWDFPLAKYIYESNNVEYFLYDEDFLK